MVAIPLGDRRERLMKMQMAQQRARLLLSLPQDMVGDRDMRQCKTSQYAEALLPKVLRRKRVILSHRKATRRDQARRGKEVKLSILSPICGITILLI